MHTLADTNEEDVGDVTVYKLKLCSHIIYLLLYHSYIVYVLFVSDTNLDCNMVHVPYVRYHNTVTSGKPGENCPALTNCPHVGFRGSVIRNQRGKMAEKSHFINKRRTPIKRRPRKNDGSKLPNFK